MSELYQKVSTLPEQAIRLIVRGEQILLNDQGQLHLPPLDEWDEHSTAVRVGELNGQTAWLLEWHDWHQAPPVGEFTSLRQLMNEPEHFQLAGRALQLSLFFRTHRFCGQCGARMRVVQEEIACHCDQCQHRAYPRLSPSMIVAVKKGRQLLLGHSQRHRNGVYSTLAGFTEPGESMEETVRREVMEETAISVSNVRYHCSQNWPFPHSMMIGFIADYAGGEIAIDTNELLDAQWFDIDDLPPIPTQGTIARTLLDAAIAEIRAELD
ncbi:NAD(+) diphosphatase [Gallaecimonas sp. GXIMD1310]|uniref:NAD(+) diphosphatase n=1 Tax=Gallaecimonas sp. GXIMD1310 TaxID=3131926 RepID=UPI00324E6A24